MMTLIMCSKSTLSRSNRVVKCFLPLGGDRYYGRFTFYVTLYNTLYN